MIPVKVEEFIRYCNFRRKHVFIDTLEFDKTLENSDSDPEITFSNAKQHLTKNQNQVSNFDFISIHLGPNDLLL